MIRDLLPFMAVAPATAYSLLSLWCGWQFFSQKSTSRSQPVLQHDHKGKASPTCTSAYNADPDSAHGHAGQDAGLSVTILKPVKGLDAGSYDNFASFCRQDYTGVLQIVFAVASPDDPVVPLIRRLQDDFPEHEIALVINPAIHGPNYKVSNLINAFPSARHDIIIVCDSDIRVSPGYLRSVTSHFVDPEVGLVTSPYRTSDVDGVAAAVEASGFTTEMIPNVLVALRLEGLSFALGASMAVRRRALDAIGGFPALVDYLADDYQLGNKIHLAGWKVILDRQFVESMVRPESLMSVLSRQLRWARTMRVSRPGGYLGSGITLPFPGLLLALLASPTLAHGVAAATLLYGVRSLVCIVYSRCYTRDMLQPRWLWLLPLRDLFSFSSWALSFLGNHVEWRGNRFLLRPGGTIEEIV